MAKVFIVYDSETGNTEKMAKTVEQGAKESNVDVVLEKVDDAAMSDLEWAYGIIIGSPNYFGNMSAKMKKFIDETVGLYMEGKLKRKVGAAFVSAAGTGTGAETTALTLITAMMGHEMIIVSAPGREQGWPGTFGVIADGLGFEGSPDEKMLNNCKNLGKRVTEIADKLI